MSQKLGQVRTWLYSSRFKQSKTPDEVKALVDTFRPKNTRLGLSGFLITDGKTVMQLLEGDPKAVRPIKLEIMADDRHTDIVSEVWTSEDDRAYPNWSMRVIDSSNYELLFKEIECSKIQTVATNIARMLFDTTFDSSDSRA